MGHAEGLHYIVQEYVPGLNLRQWISRYGPADLGRAVSIMRQTAAALAKATDAGVVHRDIKPENIMLTPEGEVKVADFGLARVAGDTQATELTQVGMTMGTPLYMSPEQVEGKPLDGRSDLYSFGATCYQMLTGNPPFVADTALGVAVQHLKREPAALESLRPISPGMCRIVHKMLIKDPAGRWQSARELLRDLRRVQQEYSADGGEESGVWQSSAVLPVNPRLEASRQLARVMRTAAVETSPRRRRWLLGLALAAMFLAGGVLAWLTTRPEPLLDVSRTGYIRVPRQANALAQVLLRQPDRHRGSLAERAGILSQEGIGRPPRQAAIGPHLLLPRQRLRSGDGDLRRAGRLDRRRQGVSSLGAGGQGRRADAGGKIQGVGRSAR